MLTCWHDRERGVIPEKWEAVLKETQVLQETQRGNNAENFTTDNVKSVAP
jgi:hypothetical protein